MFSESSRASKLLGLKSHFVEVAGFSMHYLDEGGEDLNRPIVVLLHGNPTWCYYYRHLVKELRNSFRVIVPDYIGCGLSDHPKDAHFRARHRVEHLEELLHNHLKLNKYSLVMHDWGGAIGTMLAVRNRERIEKLVFLNTTLTETETLPLIIKLSAKPFPGKYLTKHSKRFLKIMTRHGVAKKLSKEVKSGYYFPYRSRARRTAIWDFVADIPFDSNHPTYADMLELAGKLPTLADVPVQIVWGLKDPCFHREMLNKVALHFPHASILEIPDASHLVLEDAPDLANKTIKNFLLATKEENLNSRNGEYAEKRQHVLYKAFVDQVQRHPRNDAVIEPLFIGDRVQYRHVNYETLGAIVNKYQRGLTELGLRPGHRVLMLVPGSADFLALSYAVMGRGAIPFYVDPGIGRERLFKCIQEINADVFIGSPRAQLLRIKRKKLFPSLTFHLTASEWFVTGGPTINYLKKFASKPLPLVSHVGPGLVAFTSGATGVPKGVEFSSEMLSEQLRIFRDVVGLREGYKDLPLLTIFSLYTVALGVCSVFPPMDGARPLSLEAWKAIRLIEELGIDYSFGSPTLWNKIAEYCFRSKATLSSMKKILIAGADVSRSVLERVTEIVPNAEVSTPYGSTEALPVTFVTAEALFALSPRAAVGGEVGAPVGKAIQGVLVSVIEAVESPISSINNATKLNAFEIGEVIVKGRNVSPSYFHRPEATEKSKIKDGDSFWHRMGDVGYLDEEGNLYYCGRKNDVVRCHGRIYYSVPIERIFNEYSKVRRSGLLSLDGGEDVGIAIEPFPQFWPETEEKRHEFLNEMKDFASKHPLTSTIRRIYFHPSFPVDARHNAKIFRDELSAWASGLSDYDKRAA